MNNLAYNYTPAFNPVAPIVAMQCNAEDGYESFRRSRRMLLEDMPEHVREEMRRNDVNFAQMLPTGLLKAIKDGCEYDRRLVDDHEGVNLLDKLSLTPAEEKRRAIKPRHRLSFAETIEEERARNARENAEGESFLLSL